MSDTAMPATPIYSWVVPLRDCPPGDGWQPHVSLSEWQESRPGHPGRFRLLLAVSVWTDGRSGDGRWLPPRPVVVPDGVTVVATKQIIDQVVRISVCYADEADAPTVVEVPGR